MLWPDGTSVSARLSSNEQSPLAATCQVSARWSAANATWWSKTILLQGVAEVAHLFAGDHSIMIVSYDICDGLVWSIMWSDKPCILFADIEYVCDSLVKMMDQLFWGDMCKSIALPSIDGLTWNDAAVTRIDWWNGGQHHGLSDQVRGISPWSSMASYKVLWKHGGLLGISPLKPLNGRIFQQAMFDEGYWGWKKSIEILVLHQLIGPVMVNWMINGR